MFESEENEDGTKVSGNEWIQRVTSYNQLEMYTAYESHFSNELY